MVSSKIKIVRTQTSGTGFSVEYEVGGVTKGHTFPKEKKYLEENKEGIPCYVERLMELEQDVSEEVASLSEEDLRLTEKEFVFSPAQIKVIREDKIRKGNNNVKQGGDTYESL